MGLRGYPLAIGDADAGYPDDLLPVADDGKIVTQAARHVGVDQQVLETFALCHAKWAHAVARGAPGDGQGHHDPVSVQVSDPVTRLEVRPVAGTAGDPELRERGRRRIR